MSQPAQSKHAKNHGQWILVKWKHYPCNAPSIVKQLKELYQDNLEQFAVGSEYVVLGGTKYSIPVAIFLIRDYKEGFNVNLQLTAYGKRYMPSCSALSSLESALNHIARLDVSHSELLYK